MATRRQKHLCGWRGPRWLHIRRLCATCKGHYPTPEGMTEPIVGPRCWCYGGGGVLTPVKDEHDDWCWVACPHPHLEEA